MSDKYKWSYINELLGDPGKVIKELEDYKKKLYHVYTNNENLSKTETVSLGINGDGYYVVKSICIKGENVGDLRQYLWRGPDAALMQFTELLQT